MEKYLKHYQEIDNGETLAYIHEGDKKNVLLMLHGNYCSSVHWTPLIERLREDYTIYALDMRGFGDSTYKSEFDTIEELADDVSSFCDRLDLKRVSVIGWSMGGGVALALAARNPKLVKQLILIDSMSYRGYPMFVSGFRGQPNPGSIFTSKNQMAKDPFQVRPIIQAIRSRTYLMANVFWNMLVFTGYSSPKYYESRYYHIETFKQRCIISALWSMANFNMSDLPTFYSMGNGSAHQVKCPIVSYWGENDRIIPFEMANENCVGFPQLEFVSIKDAGHAPIFDHPDYLADEIKKRTVD